LLIANVLGFAQSRFDGAEFRAKIRWKRCAGRIILAKL